MVQPKEAVISSYGEDILVFREITKAECPGFIQ